MNPEERVSERLVEYIVDGAGALVEFVDVPVLPVMEETVDSRERIQQRTVEEIVHVPILQGMSAVFCVSHISFSCVVLTAA